jgi:ubiquinone/menaquinone biosynthesis C-methylase UbiE
MRFEHEDNCDMSDLGLGAWERIHHRFGMAGEGQAAIIERYLITHPGRGLYVGCGAVNAAGDHKIENLAEFTHDLVVIDIGDGIISDAKAVYCDMPNVTFKVADARNLSEFEEQSFDLILALGLFAHVSLEDVPTVFEEFWRVCRRGGAVVVTNSTRHFRDAYIDAAFEYGWELRDEKEGNCTASTTGRRYLLAFAKSNE